MAQWTSHRHLTPTSRVRHSAGAGTFFSFFSLFFFLFNDLNESIFTINNCQQKKQNKKGAPLLGLAKSIYYMLLKINITT